MSRLYARYFGGDLKLMNIPGYGVDAYLFLKKLGDQEWQEDIDTPTQRGEAALNSGGSDTVLH